MNLLQGAAAILSIGREIENQKTAALEAACLIVETESKSVLGTDGYGWPALQPETIARKTQPGMLLETGELRDSIEHVVSSPSSATVGSNNDKAVWHELGTSRGIPPRSFLAQAAVHKEQEIVSEIGKVLFRGVGALTKV